MQEGNIKIFPRSKAYGENLDRIKWDTQKNTQDAGKPGDPKHTIRDSFLRESAKNTLYYILMGICEDTTPVVAINTLRLAQRIFDDTFDEKVRELQREIHENS